MPRSARPRAARRATTSAGASTSRCPTTSRCAPSASRSEEGGYVDNVFGTNARWSVRQRRDVVEEDRNDWTDVRRPCRGALADQPRVGDHAQPDRPARRQRGRLGDGPGPRRQQGHALLWTSGVTTSGTRRRCDAQGRPGLRGAVGDGVLFRPQDQVPVGQHELRPVAHRVLRRLPRLRPLQHELPDRPDFNYQKQDRWSYEVRLTSQGDSSSSGWRARSTRTSTTGGTTARRIPGLETTTAWETRNTCAGYYNGLGYDVQYPLNPTDDLLHRYLRTDGQADGVLRRDDLRPDRQWSVTGGARWFEYDREGFELRARVLSASRCAATASRTAAARRSRDRTRHGFKFSTQYSFDGQRMIYALYSEGFRLGGNNSAARRGNRHPAARVRAGHAEELRSGLQEPMVGRDRCSSTSPRSSCSGTTSSSTGRARTRATRGGCAERSMAARPSRRAPRSACSWSPTENFSIDASAFLADPEFSEDTFTPEQDPSDPDDGPADCGRHRHAGLAEGEVLALGGIHVPNLFGLQGDFWTRISYSYQSEVWNRPGRDLGLRGSRDARGAGGRARIAHPVLVIDDAAARVHA